MDCPVIKFILLKYCIDKPFYLLSTYVPSATLDLEVADNQYMFVYKIKIFRRSINHLSGNKSIH